MFREFVHRYLKVPYRLNILEHGSAKRASVTVVMLHGLGGSGQTWAPIVKALPSDVRIITIDLLGFGESPRPRKAVYNARTQARAVLRALRKRRVYRNVIMVGHSLGALVAVECARRAKLPISQLILCSPPFYHPEKLSSSKLNSHDAALMKLYAEMRREPTRALKLLEFASRIGIINPGFRVDASNIDAYIATLTTAIMNQSAYYDALKLRLPTHIISGRLDLLVIVANLRSLVKSNQNITLQRVNAAHEIRGVYRTAVVRAIKQAIEHVKATKYKV